MKAGSPQARSAPPTIGSAAALLLLRETGGMEINAQPGARRALFLSTTAFAVAFAAWGLLSGLAPILKQQYGLTTTQVSLMVAIPVLLGSIGRLPMGLLADRWGAKPVLVGLLFAITVPALALAAVHSYPGLLLWGFFLGLAGTSFSVGVAYTSPWFSKEQQGFALGVFGAGNVGQSIAVFGAPVLAARWGLAAPFLLFGGLAFLWGVVLLLSAQRPPQTRRRVSLGEALRPLRTAPLSWLLSLFYFVTFGGFVALGIYMPSLLKEVFHLTPADAGARTAGFVIVATAARPVGGWLSDRLGGARLLTWVFLALAVLAFGLSTDLMPLFTTAALGIALFLGLGNGAVFKLVPQYFPDQVGTVTGLVGAAGGLGGFFPPLVLGLLKDQVGSFTPGFVLLALFALTCLALDRRLLVGRNRPGLVQATG
jgi:NNP family nitrate/nitrite transporter-like MFS transporter